MLNSRVWGGFLLSCQQQSAWRMGDLDRWKEWKEPAAFSMLTPPANQGDMVEGHNKG
jgi:hypothetical protein